MDSHCALVLVNVLPSCFHGASMDSHGAVVVFHSAFMTASMVLSWWCARLPYNAFIVLPWDLHGLP